MQALTITDVSGLARFGVKGPEASNWLTRHKVIVPAKANTWLLSANTIVMRLGFSEFLIEDQMGGDCCVKLVSDHNRVAGVFKVARVDAAFLLAGSDVDKLLSEVCSLDLSTSALLENEVVMTQIAGISATLLRQSINNEAVYRLWCDGTYSAYMKRTLLEISSELNGG